MDYKEKYEQALERAKNLHKDAIDMGENIRAKQCEIIFPELKESEDEKIRKALIRFHKSTIDVDGIKGEDIIAWLEKQGESIKIKKGKNYLCTKTHKYAGVEWIEGVKYYSPEDYSLVNQGCTCYCPKCSKEEHNNFFKEVEYDGCLEKQGKKKPFDYENANIQQKDFAPKATTANRQVYNRAILKLLSNYVEKYPDIRFGQMLYNLGVNPHFDQESRETYWNLNETINKSKDESKN